jgi:hypothetical protein
MTQQATWKNRAIHGGITGALLTGFIITLVVLVGADTYPELRVEDMDPFFMKHAILVLSLFGAYSGAVIGGLTARPSG